MIARRVVALLLMLAAPAMAAACGTCVTSLVERVLPPVMSWIVVGLGAYVLTVALVGNPWSKTWSQVFHPIMAVVIVVMAVLASGCFGPVPFLALLALSLRAMADTAMSPGRPGWRRVSAIILLVATFMALVGTLLIASEEARGRDRVDWILRWRDAGPSIETVRAMTVGGNVHELRRLMASDSGFVCRYAAEGLVKVGKPRLDAPPIIEALKRAEKDNDLNSVELLDKALEGLLGQRPASGSTAADWSSLFESLHKETATAS